MTLLLLLLACTGPKLDGDDSAADDSAVTSADSGADDSGADDSGADDSAADDSATDDSAPPSDRDGDGFPGSQDCDDGDPRVYPGAEEVFNGYDDDCDGVVDANGSYSGAFTGLAIAEYEGQRYRFDLSCPATLTRALSDVDFVVTCAQDTRDEDAMRLLGAEITMRPVDGYHWTHEAWSDRVEVASSNGWDTDADGALSWPSLERADLTVNLSAVYLAISGDVVLRRD